MKVAVALIFRTNVGAYFWAFSAGFLVVASMMYTFSRDGAPFGYSPIITMATMAFIWTDALGLALFSTSKHCLRVPIEPDSHVLIEWCSFFRKEEDIVARTVIAPATVYKSTDDKGAPFLMLASRFRKELIIEVIHPRASCEAPGVRFSAILNSPCPKELRE